MAELERSRQVREEEVSPSQWGPRSLGMTAGGGVQEEPSSWD